MKRERFAIGFIGSEKQFRTVVSVFTAVVFLFSTLSYDIAEAITSQTAGIEGFVHSVSEVDHLAAFCPEIFSLPEYMGKVEHRYKGGSSERMVIHIQDAHCNYACQKRVSEIIEYLNEKYGINVVNLEGGSGEYDLSIFTRIEDRTIRQRVTDYFLREGLINGAEYFAANNPERVQLWGVEDVDLYVANLDAYRKSLRYETEISRHLGSLRHILNNLKARIYSPEMLEFDIKYGSYKAGNMDFREYLTWLLAMAVGRVIDVRQYTSIYLLGQTIEEEMNIDFHEANIERNRLIQELEKMLSRREFENLAAKTIKFRREHISRYEYYSYLFRCARLVAADIDDYPQLQKYMVYVSMYEEIDRSRIMQELEMLEDKLRTDIARNREERELALLSKHLSIKENMFGIKLTREDYRYYGENREAFNVSNFVSFIDRYAPLYTIKARPDSSIAELDLYREKLSEFYEYSFRRDESFVINMASGNVSQHTGNALPVIIVTGGFHTENLARLFQEDNISYVSIMPDFRSCDRIENRYFALLSGESSSVMGSLQDFTYSSALAIASFLNAGINDGLSEGRRRLLVFDLLARWREEKEKHEMSPSGRKEGLLINEKNRHLALDWDGNVISIEEADLDRFVTVTISEGYLSDQFDRSGFVGFTDSAPDRRLEEYILSQIREQSGKIDTHVEKIFEGDLKVDQYAKKVVNSLESGNLVSIRLNNLAGEEGLRGYEKVSELFDAIQGEMDVQFPDVPDQDHPVAVGLLAKEILKNAFVHGNGLDFESPIFIRVRRFEEQNILEVYDTAKVKETETKDTLNKEKARRAGLFGEGIGEKWLKDEQYVRQEIRYGNEKIGTVASLVLNPKRFIDPLKDSPATIQISTVGGEDLHSHIVREDGISPILNRLSRLMGIVSFSTPLHEFSHILAAMLFRVALPWGWTDLLTGRISTGEGITASDKAMSRVRAAGMIGNLAIGGILGIVAAGLIVSSPVTFGGWILAWGAFFNILSGISEFLPGGEMSQSKTDIASKRSFQEYGSKLLKLEKEGLIDTYRSQEDFVDNREFWLKIIEDFVEPRLEEMSREYSKKLPHRGFYDALEKILDKNTPVGSEILISEPLTSEMLERVGQVEDMEIGLFRLRGTGEWVMKKGTSDSVQMLLEKDVFHDIFIHNHPQYDDPVVPSASDVYNQFWTVGVTGLVLGRSGAVHYDTDGLIHTKDPQKFEENFDLSYWELEDKIPHGGWTLNEKGQYTDEATEEMREIYRQIGVLVGNLISWDELDMEDLGRRSTSVSESMLSRNPRSRNFALDLALRILTPDQICEMIGLYSRDESEKTQSKALDYLAKHFEKDKINFVNAVKSFLDSKIFSSKIAAFKILFEHGVVDEDVFQKFSDFVGEFGWWEVLAAFSKYRKDLPKTIWDNFSGDLDKLFKNSPPDEIVLSPVSASLMLKSSEDNRHKKIVSYLLFLLERKEKKALENALSVLASSEEGKELVFIFVKENREIIDPSTQVKCAWNIVRLRKDSEDAVNMAREIMLGISFDWFHEIFKIADQDIGGSLSSKFVSLMDEEYIDGLGSYDAKRARIMKQKEKDKFRIGRLSKDIRHISKDIRHSYLEDVRKLSEEWSSLSDEQFRRMILNDFSPESAGHLKVALNYFESALRQRYPDLDISLGKTHFFLDRNDPDPSEYRYIMSLARDFYKSHGQTLLVLDFHWEDGQEDLNIVPRQDSGTVSDYFDTEKRESLFKDFMKKITKSGMDFIHLDHHYGSDILAVISTTVLMADFVTYLHELGTEEAFTALDRLSESSNVSFFDHADADIVLANFIARNAKDKEFLAKNGELLKSAALMNDYGKKPEEKEAEIFFLVMRGLEIDIMSGKLSLLDAMDKIRGVVEFSRKYRERSAGELYSDEKIKKLEPENMGYLITAYDEEKHGREIILEAFEKGVVMVEGNVITLDLREDQGELDNLLFLRTLQDNKDRLSKDYPGILETPGVVQLRYYKDGKRFIKLRSFFAGEFGRSDYVDIGDLTEDLKKKPFIKDLGAGGRALAGGISKSGIDPSKIENKNYAQEITDAINESISRRRQVKGLLRWKKQKGNDTAVISDIHGNWDHAEKLIDEYLRQGVRRFQFCGDYIDLDENDNLKVLEGIKKLQQGEYVFDGIKMDDVEVNILLGNHDIKMIQAMMGDFEAFKKWVSTGGLYVLIEAKLKSAAIEDLKKKLKDVEENLKDEPAKVKGAAIGIAFNKYFEGNTVKLRDLFREFIHNAKLEEHAKWLLEKGDLFNVDERGVFYSHAGIPADLQAGKFTMTLENIKTLQIRFKELGKRFFEEGADKELLFEKISPEETGTLKKVLEFVENKDKQEGLKAFMERLDKDKDPSGVMAHRLLDSLGVSAMVFGHRKQKSFYTAGEGLIWGIDLEWARYYDPVHKAGRGGGLLLGTDGIIPHYFEDGKEGRILTGEKIELTKTISDRVHSIMSATSTEVFFPDPILRTEEGTFVMDSGAVLTPHETAKSFLVSQMTSVLEEVMDGVFRYLFSGKECWDYVVGNVPVDDQGNKMEEFVFASSMSGVSGGARRLAENFKIGNLNSRFVMGTREAKNVVVDILDLVDKGIEQERIHMSLSKSVLAEINENDVLLDKIENTVSMRYDNIRNFLEDYVLLDIIVDTHRDMPNVIQAMPYGRAHILGVTKLNAAHIAKNAPGDIEARRSVIRSLAFAMGLLSNNLDRVSEIASILSEKAERDEEFYKIVLKIGLPPIEELNMSMIRESYEAEAAVLRSL